MALLTLTQRPDAHQLALFQQWLGPDDWLLLTGDARPLFWLPNPTPARGCIRAQDAQSLAGERHPDWSLISDADWVQLSAEQTPLVTW